MQLDDGRVEPLHHPGEQYALAGLGCDDEELAYAEGRMLHCEEQVCRRCGAISVQRNFVRVLPPARMAARPWALTLLIALLAAWSAWAAFRFDVPIAFGVAAALAHLTVIRSRDWFATRRRLRVLGQPFGRPPPLVEEYCCEMPDPIPVHQVDGDHLMPCPKCGALAVRCTCCGIC